MRKLLDWVRPLWRSAHPSPSHRPDEVVLRVEEMENRVVPSTFTAANFPTSAAGVGLYLNDGTSASSWVLISSVQAQGFVVDSQGDVLADFTAAAGAKNPGLQLFNHATGTWTLLTNVLPQTFFNEGHSFAIAVGANGNPIVVASFAQNLAQGVMGGVQETTDFGAHWRLLSSLPLQGAFGYGLDVDDNGDVVAQFGGTIPGIQYFNASTGNWTQISNTRYDTGIPDSTIRMNAKGDVVAVFNAVGSPTVGPSLQTISHDAAIDGSRALNSWQVIANVEPTSFSIGDNGIVATFLNSKFGDIQLFQNGVWKLLDSTTSNDDAQAGIDKTGTVVDYQNVSSPDAAAGIYLLQNGNGPGQWTTLSLDAQNGNPVGDAPGGPLDDAGFGQIEVGAK